MWKPDNEYWWGWRVTACLACTCAGTMLGLMVSVAFLRTYGLPDTPGGMIVFAGVVSGSVGLAAALLLQLLMKEENRPTQSPTRRE